MIDNYSYDEAKFFLGLGTPTYELSKLHEAGGLDMAGLPSGVESWVW